MFFLKKRRGVSLLITLSIIAAMLAMIGVLFGYIHAARERADFDAATVQSNLLRADLNALLKKALGTKPSVHTMENFYKIPFYVQTKSGIFQLQAGCSPLMNRLRIDWLGMDVRRKDPRRYQLALETFETLAQQANLEDPSLFLELITQALEGQGVRYGAVERLQGKKGIINKRSFRRLMDEYRLQKDDPKIYQIKWENFFTFSEERKIKELDAQFAPPELLAMLFDVDPAVVKEDFIPGKLDDFLSEIGENRKRYAWLFTKGTLAAMECKGSFAYRGKSYPFHFDYIQQRIKNFGLGYK